MQLEEEEEEEEPGQWTTMVSQCASCLLEVVWCMTDGMPQCGVKQCPLHADDWCT